MFLKAASLTTLLLSAITSTALGSSGTCEPNADVHRDFCSPKPHDVCVAHSSVCHWAESTVIYLHGEEQNGERRCQAQAGKEAHAGFCAGLNLQTCGAHTQVCELR